MFVIDVSGAVLTRATSPELGLFVHFSSTFPGLKSIGHITFLPRQIGAKGESAASDVCERLVTDRSLLSRFELHGGRALPLATLSCIGS